MQSLLVDERLIAPLVETHPALSGRDVRLMVPLFKLDFWSIEVMSVVQFRVDASRASAAMWLAFCPMVLAVVGGLNR